MTPDGREAWMQELAELRARLDRLELGQQAVFAGLREKIAELENTAAKKAAPGPLPVEEIVGLQEMPEPPSLLPSPIPPVPAAAPATPQPEVPILTPAPPAAMPAAKAKEEGGFEMQLGRVWLVRLGIVLLLTGLVLLGNFAYKNWIREMPNGVRLLGLFLCAGALVETGRRLAARESLRKFGEVILAGGMSFFYYCVFVSHHVPRLQVIDSPVLAGVLLLGAAGAIVAVSWIRNARTTAVLGILLASYSTMLQPIGWLSCISSVILAAAGAFFMLRPGWMGPGIASMTGTYGAFLGWQLMGASGADTRDPAILWFLPPVWITLALPGVMGRFRDTMGGRARAWFTGANNAAFFALFSWLWWRRFQGDDYWMVCGIFGLVLLAMGIHGRRRSEIAGGVSMFQGLALFSLAMVVRLEGVHLALGLAVEALALALAFAKFRGRSELLFSCLAAVAVPGLIFIRYLPWVSADRLPLWSAGLAALVVAASAVPLRIGGLKLEVGRFAKAARGGAMLNFAMAVLMGVLGWGLKLPPPWPAPVMAGVAAALCAAMLLAPRGTRMPEIGFGALVFLFAPFNSALPIGPWWPSAVIALFAITAAWLWHWRERREGEAMPDECLAPLHGWVYAGLTAAAALCSILLVTEGHEGSLLWVGLVALALLAAALFGKIRRLAPSAAVMLLLPAVYIGKIADTLLLTGSALAMLALLLISGKDLPRFHFVATTVVLRATAFIGACLFWLKFAPGFLGDGLAVTAMVLLGIGIFRKIRTLPEVWGFLGLSVLWLLRESDGRWTVNPLATWRGWAVVAALAGLVVWTGCFRKSGDRRPAMVAGWSAVVVTSIWATQMLVWRHYWHAVSLLWTLLGFGVVTAGLLMDQLALRQSGFCLLAMALLKVFVKDVWDFNAFTRVIAFILLGVALILLGLFYNRFAPMLKRLLEEESMPEESKPQNPPQ